MSRSIFIAAALALAVTLPAVSAQAQAPRTFVSAAGSDSNPCSFAAPCRHFQAAVNATSLGGEVDALDPAGYGPIVISQAITIEGQGWSYIAPPAGGNAITVDVSNGNGNVSVVIRGVSLNGAGIAGGTTGIAFNNGKGLEVINCVIRNFTGSGIAFAPFADSFPLARIDVSDSIVADNGGHGIYVQPTGSFTPVTAKFNRVQATNNGEDGIGIYGNLLIGGPNLLAVVSDSSASGNAIGFHAFTVSGQLPVTMEVSRSVAANSTTAGIDADGGNATLRIGQSQVVGNATGWIAKNGGAITSYGDNYIDDNGASDTAPGKIPPK